MTDIAPPPRDCRQCGEPIEEARLRRRAVYCSLSCQVAWHGKGTERDFAATRMNLATGTVGALAEMAVAVDLLERGYEVFRSVSPAATCDLVVLLGTRSLRVEVRTAYLRGETDLHINIPQKDAGRQDLYGFVVHTSPRQISYVWPDKTPVDWDAIA